MGATKWKDTHEYQRILEILDDYWLSEPDEAYVKVTMEMIKADGQHQEKIITWCNPYMDRETILDLMNERSNDEEDILRPLP